MKVELERNSLREIYEDGTLVRVTAMVWLHHPRHGPARMSIDINPGPWRTAPPAARKGLIRAAAATAAAAKRTELDAQAARSVRRVDDAGLDVDFDL